jgi:hypothetical protein
MSEAPATRASEPAKTERLTLTRDMSKFLVELSIAVHKHAMYPGGHPSLSAAVDGVTRRAERMLESRPTLVFGVARRQLIIDGVATDPDQPVLRRLAESLHRHHLGAVSFARGVEPAEMGQALRALSTEIERDGPLGLAPAGHLPNWPHVKLHPLTFERLQLIGDATGEGGSGGGDARGAWLWVGLARAAMATQPSEVAEAATAVEPTKIARAIDDHHGAAAYDQVIVGYLLQIAQELKSASGTDADMLRRRTAQLVRALQPDTLRRLVTMGGNAAQRREFVLNATSGMAVDAVVEILKAAADASGQTISHGLVRMLSKLAEHASTGGDQVRVLADGALREQVTRLLSGWELADPNPEAYGKVLQHIATAAAPRTRTQPQQVDDQDPLRILQMSLEVGDFGPLVERALDRVIRDGRLAAVLHLTDSLPSGARSAAEHILIHLAAPASIAKLVAQDPIDWEALDRVFPLITIQGFELLLDTLATSKNRSTRRRLLDRLAATDLDVAPPIAARLGDRHWYVQRNMLVLLQRMNRVPDGFSLVQWSQHGDARVRFEAIQLQLALQGHRDQGVRLALQDHDLRILRLGLMAIQHECPPPLAALVAAVAINARIAEELRVLAARALARCHDFHARDALLQLVDGGRTLLGRPRLAPPTPLCVAALRSLSEGWPTDPYVAPILSLATSSPDPELRQAATLTRAS